MFSLKQEILINNGNDSDNNSVRQRGRERERESEGRGSSWANGVAKKPPKTEGNDEDEDDEEEDEEDNEEAGALDNVMLIVPAIVVVVVVALTIVVVVVVAAMGAHSPMRHILIANNCRRQRSCFSVTCRTARRCPALPTHPTSLPRRLPLASVQIYDILLSAIVAAIYAPLLPCSFSFKGQRQWQGRVLGRGSVARALNGTPFSNPPTSLRAAYGN